MIGPSQLAPATTAAPVAPAAPAASIKTPVKLAKTSIQKQHYQL
jgi:hypothetical protein